MLPEYSGLPDVISDCFQLLHLNIASWCTYLWRASEAGLLNAFVHTLQYKMLCICNVIGDWFWFAQSLYILIAQFSQFHSTFV